MLALGRPLVTKGKHLKVSRCREFCKNRARSTLAGLLPALGGHEAGSCVVVWLCGCVLHEKQGAGPGVGKCLLFQKAGTDIVILMCYPC